VNEFCTVVWDLEHTEKNSTTDENSTSIIFKSPSEEPISSICWLNDPNLLAVGTSISYVRVYDTRVDNSGNEPITISAHQSTRPRKVKGIRLDPFNDLTIATFSDSALEPIKVWDLRRGSNSKPKITVYPHELYPGEGTTNTNTVNIGSTNPISLSSQQSSVVDVAWSNSRQNVLAVATSHQRNISLYSTVKNLSEVVTRIPIHTIPINEPVKCLSWQLPFLIPSVIIDKSKDNKVIAPSSTDPNNSGHRLLVATNTSFVVVEVIESVGIGYGNGYYITSSGCKLGCWRNLVTEEFHIEEISKDIELLMRHRSRKGYSFDTGKNLQVLSDEVDRLSIENNHSSSNSNSNSSNSSSNNISDEDIREFKLSRQDLICAWNWLHRVETLRQENPSLLLQTCGALSLIKEDINSGESSSSIFHQGVGTMVFSSPNRNQVRVICGWTDGSWNVGKPSSQTIPPSPTSSSHIESYNLATEEDNDGEDTAQSISPSYHDRAKEDLLAVTDDTNEINSFERAVALALWHGNCELAIYIIQKNHSDITSLKKRTYHPFPRNEIVNKDGNNNDHDDDYVEVDDDDDDGLQDKIHASKNIPNDYLHILSLVAMCIAGFAGPTESTSKSTIGQSPVWSSMCEVVISQLQQSIETYIRPSTAYLIACCQFLLSNIKSLAIIDNTVKDNRYTEILDDTRLALQDRVAFACTYVPDSVLLNWLNDQCQTATMTGRLEGIVVSGLSSQGLNILQRYLDCHDDIQTVALIAGRILEAKDGGAHSHSQSQGSRANGAVENWPREVVWLNEYRGLLNRWRMFFERAGLDVELGKALRQQVGSVNPPSHTFPQNQSRAPRAAPRVRELYALPSHQDSAHVFLRCHYCSASLPVDPLQQNQSTLAFLRKQRPVVGSCPHCKKQLPRCYVCLLYMGLVNPCAEFNRVMSIRRRVADAALLAARRTGPPDKPGAAVSMPDNDTERVADHNTLEYGKWFFFCQRCRHGGHATCIESWFDHAQNIGVKTNRTGTSHGNQGYEVCGVSGCFCRCTLLR
jgi:hypothetical protein